MAVTRRSDTHNRLTYQPALDGLRAVAVVAVLLYHHHRGPGFGRVGRGGFLGVDVFFVLSGYLITALLLHEQGSKGSIAFGRFWARRARRLLPALLVMFVLVVVLGRLAYDASQQYMIRDDLPYALFYLENWHLALWHGTQSAISHTWSLSVEEQFYLVWPVVLSVLLVLTRRRPRQLSFVIAGLALVSAAWTAVSLSTVRSYLGTDARAQELLIGATLAAAATRFTLTVPERFRGLLNVGGALLVVWLVTLLLGAPGSAELWQRGGMFVFAIGTALLIFAAVQSHGTARAILATPVLVAIGQISYGLYLFHFPVFAWTRSWTSVPRAPLLVIRVGITAAIAIASYLLIEHPIRQGRYSWRVLAPVGGCVLAGVVALAPIGVMRSVPQPKSKLLGYVLGVAAHNTPPGARRVLVVGGNRASLLNLETKGPISIGSLWGVSVGTVGCGLTSSSRSCRAVPDDLRAISSAFHTNAVVLMPDDFDLVGGSTGAGSMFNRRAVTARLDAMRRDIGRRQMAVLPIQCGEGLAKERDAFNATLRAWAERHHVTIASAEAGQCGTGALSDESTVAVWKSIAELVHTTG